ncbi:hypothetical protein Tsubulata_038726 [Turnera subulata]|uniref:RRM domain-containing protein n=1 Tax=Turnera subulata TaxID=218843 RepID=A0A9Q0GE52_9ROSI|nr:hypothetical protein Tsubulata_038726 [Turnera subulata]
MAAEYSTLYVGNIHHMVTEVLLGELFTQGAPVGKALKIFNRVPLNGTPLSVCKAYGGNRPHLLIGNLAPEVTEQLLTHIFGNFGAIMGDDEFSMMRSKEFTWEFVLSIIEQL